MQNPLIRPRGGLLRLGGGLIKPRGGLLSGLNARAVTCYTPDTLTPANAATILTKSQPTYMYRGNLATGAVELVSDAGDLIDSVAPSDVPTKEFGDVPLDATTTVFAKGSTAAMTAPNNTIGDAAAQTITGIAVMRYTEADSIGTYRSIVSKRMSGASPFGWELASQDRQPRFAAQNADGFVAYQIPVDHGTAPGQTLLFKNSVADGEAGVWSREGSNTGAPTSIATLAAATALTIGRSINRSAAGFSFALLMLWVGPTGDGFGEADRLKMAQALRLEA